MARTVIALYDDFTSANDAIREMVNNGFNRSDISIMAHDESGEYSQYLKHSGDAMQAPDSGASTGAGVGAGVGAAVGGLAGILIGLGALAIPGIGPVVAAGPLAAALGGLAGAGTGAVAGGITGGLIGALSDMGVPSENAGYFAEGVRRGGTLVAARVSDDMAGTARDILNRHDPVDMNERVSNWRQSGWTGYSNEESAYLGSQQREEYAQSEYIPSTGEPRMSDTTDATTDWNRQVHDQRSEGMDTGTSTDYDDHDDNPITHPTSESMGTNTTANYGYSDYTSYQEGFRNHFTNSMYGNTYTYDQYEPAYRYGYDLATNERYRDRDWDDIEYEARGYWDERNPGTWDRIKDAVRYAWEEVKNALS